MRRRNDGWEHQDDGAGGRVCAAWAGVWILCIRCAVFVFAAGHFLIINLCCVGGSTIVILFEKGKVEWDEDLLINGRASLETLVRVGMGIGKGRPE